MNAWAQGLEQPMNIDYRFYAPSLPLGPVGSFGTASGSLLPLYGPIPESEATSYNVEVLSGAGQNDLAMLMTAAPIRNVGLLDVAPFPIQPQEWLGGVQGVFH